MYENFATPEILNNNSVLWDPFHPQIELKKTEPPQRYPLCRKSSLEKAFPYEYKTPSPWRNEPVAGVECDGRVNLSGRGARPRMASMIGVEDAKNLVQELRIQRFFCRR